MYNFVNNIIKKIGKISKYTTTITENQGKLYIEEKKVTVFTNWQNIKENCRNSQSWSHIKIRSPGSHYIDLIKTLQQ